MRGRPLTIGFHISKTRGLDGERRDVTIIDAITGDIETANVSHPCAQIFVTGPRKSNEILSAEDKIQIQKYITKTKLPLVIHGAYVDNPWSRDKPNHFPIHNIRKELRIAAHIGATGVIVHAANGARDTIAKVLPAIVKDLTGVTLWIEINAAKPTKDTFETPEKLHALFSQVADYTNIGLCIDTAHLHSCGVSMTSYNAAATWLNDLKHLLPDIPMMMHLNDSASDLGSGMDMHACLTRGNIWGGDINVAESGLMAVLEWCSKYDVICVLERGAGVMDDIKLIKSLGY